MTDHRLRVAAYGVCLRDDLILLARCFTPDRTEHYWTMPGGKVEHGEDPLDTVVRELAEETGYVVAVERLLGVESRCHDIDWGIPGGGDLHRLSLTYIVRIVGGELRSEVDGGTDLAAWVSLADLPNMERTVSVDVALDLVRTAPADGHVASPPATGLLRH